MENLPLRMLFLVSTRSMVGFLASLVTILIRNLLLSLQVNLEQEELLCLITIMHSFICINKKL